ncbi:MAG: TolC family protein [Gammaproteobacteria bacterium]|nr:TolC family protein [Gammaproteobacteria bacterium]
MIEIRVCTLLALSVLAAGCATTPVGQDGSRVAAAVIMAGSSTARLPAPDDPYLDPRFLESELSADRAVQAALANNPQVRAQLARLDAAQAERVQAGLISNPMLSLMALRPDGGGRIELQYNLMQDLFDLFTRSRRVAVADAATRQVEADVIGQLVALVHDTKAAYYEALAAQAVVASVRDGWLLETEVLQLRTGEARQGAIRASAVTDQQALVSMQAHELQSAEAALARARAALALQLGLRSSGNIRLPASFPTFSFPGIDEPALQALASTHRASLAAADANVQQARSDRLLRTGALRATQPSLGPAGMRETSGMTFAGAGLQLALPVFDTGRARRDLADAQVAQAEFSAEAVRRQVPLEVELAIANLVAADQAAGHADHHLGQQTRLENLARQTYRQGATDSSAVFDARRAHLASVKDVIEAQRARWEASVDLERATGVAVLEAAATRQ